MEMSKLKHLQRLITTFELEYINFEHKPQGHQISNTFQFKIKESFETLETSAVDMTAAHSSTTVKPVFNGNFDNSYHH